MRKINNEITFPVNFQLITTMFFSLFQFKQIFPECLIKIVAKREENSKIDQIIMHKRESKFQEKRNILLSKTSSFLISIIGTHKSCYGNMLCFHAGSDARVPITPKIRMSIAKLLLSLRRYYFWKRMKRQILVIFASIQSGIGKSRCRWLTPLLHQKFHAHALFKQCFQTISFLNLQLQCILRNPLKANHIKLYWVALLHRAATKTE